MYTLNADTRAFFFDVFGTCVDWRKTVTNGLNEACNNVLNDPDSTISPFVRAKASDLGIKGWGDFAAKWRQTYYVFTRSLANDAGLRWKTVDDHHLQSLRELLAKHGLTDQSDVAGNLWSDEEVISLSTIWHRLDPWSDTVEGLEMLTRNYFTVTLSNGNISLLEDMQAHSGMKFTHTFSSELFGTYKPNPAIYNGAAQRLELANEQCVMLAAHLGDLEAAKGCGFQTVYVERPQEESYDVEEARKKGFVDLWIKEDENGFVAVAERIGLQRVKT